MKKLKFVIPTIALVGVALLPNKKIHQAQLDYPKSVAVGERIHVSLNFEEGAIPFRLRSDTFELVNVESYTVPSSKLRNGTTVLGYTSMSIELKNLVPHKSGIIGTLDYTVE